MTAYLRFPYQIDDSGRTATADLATYVEGLIYLVLETDPGERVNRPGFGGGLKALLFEVLDSGLAGAAETLVRGKLLQFLGDVIAIQSLTVQAQNDELLLSLTYLVKQTRGSHKTVLFIASPALSWSQAASSSGGTGRVRASIGEL